MKICVFLGSELSNSIYTQAAKDLGKALALGNHELIYGGVKNGLMGVLADEALKHNGKVIGVMSQEFSNEIMHSGLTKLYIVEDMSERIMKEEEISDAFIMFPGGIGTFDEFFKIWTMKKVQQIKKPLAILNVGEIFSPLIKQIHVLSETGFIKKPVLDLISVYDDVSSLLEGTVGMIQ